MNLFNRQSRRAQAAQARGAGLPTHVSADDHETIMAARHKAEIAIAAFHETMYRMGGKYHFDPNADGVHNETRQIIRVSRSGDGAVSEGKIRVVQDAPAPTEGALRQAISQGEFVPARVVSDEPPAEPKPADR